MSRRVIIRATLYDYHFTVVRRTASATGAWWKRERRGEYLPAVSLEGFSRQFRIV